MIVLTKTQAEYVRIANERFGHPGKITRKEMQILVDEKLVNHLAFWMRDIPNFKLGRAAYKLPDNNEIEVRNNLPRGRKKKDKNSSCEPE